MTMHRSAACVLAIGVMAGLCGAQQGGTPTDPARPPQQAAPNPPRQLRPDGGAPSNWTPPKPEVTPIDPGLDVPAAIDAAKKRAAAGGRRVLVMWLGDAGGDFTRQLLNVTRTEGMRRLLGLEFETVWADAGSGPKGEANRAAAKTMGAEVKPGEMHPLLQVLDADGKSVVVRAMRDMVDDTRPSAYSVLKFEDFLNQNKAPAPKAQDLLDAAVAQAKAGGKFVLVSFGEYGEPWSKLFQDWLAQPEVARALGPYAVVRHIELARDAGSPDVLEKLGGVHVQSLPWFAIVGGDGKVIGRSQSEKTPNIGFPTDDGEIAQFLDLLRAGAPKLAEADARAIRDSLVEHRSRKR